MTQLGDLWSRFWTQDEEEKEKKERKKKEGGGKENITLLEAE